MPLFFLDTSALVKAYVEEPGTDRLLPLLRDLAHNRFAILSLAMVELRSAVRRREREGDITEAQVAAILAAARAHAETIFIQQAVTGSVIDVATDLIDRHPLRAFDAMQLAGSLVVSRLMNEPLAFVCSDARLNAAAQAEGLGILDPTL